MLARGRRSLIAARRIPGTGTSSRQYIVALLILLAALFQSSISPGFEIFGVIPDLVLVFLATWAAVARPNGLMFWGFGAGFLLDVLSGVPAGANMLALSLATFVASMGGAGLFRTNLIWALLASLLGTLVYYPTMMLVLAVQGYSVDWFSAIVTTTPAALVVNLMTCVLIYRPVTLLERLTRARRRYTMS